MDRYHIDKCVNAFASKNISNAKNVTYCLAVIVLVLLASSTDKCSINAKAISPNADTIFYRIDTTIRSMEKQTWMQSIDFLRQRKAKLKKTKNYIVIDETYDSYTGKLLHDEKKHKDQLTSRDKFALKWIHKYKPSRGDTGSYKYLVFALVYGNTRRILRVKALKRNEKYKDFIVKTLIELRAEVGFVCALFDRGFYDGKLVENLKNNNIPFIIRAKISKTMKKVYGFSIHWKCYIDYQIGKEGLGNLVLGAEIVASHRMTWAFITNLELKDWSDTREFYKKRWNIENIFKATDGIQLRVQTSNPTTRMFCVCLSFLFYNAWQTKHKRKLITLHNFIMNNCVAVFNIVVRYIRSLRRSIAFYRDKLKINIPFWDRIIASM
jgi:hypothetical protein